MRMLGWVSVLLVVSNCLFSVQGQERDFRPPNVDQVKKLAQTIEILSDSANGALLEATASSEEWYSGKEKWTTSSNAKISTDSTGSSRHMSLEHEMRSEGVVRSSYQQSSRYVNGEYAFNYKMLRLSSDNDPRHLVLGFVKKFGIGDLFYGYVGLLVGVCETENKSIKELIDLDQCLFAVDEGTNTTFVKVEKSGICRCELSLDSRDFRIKSLTIIKEADDQFGQIDGVKLKDQEISPNEGTTRTIVSYSNLVYSGQLLESFDINTNVTGMHGTTWTCNAHAAITRRDNLGAQEIPGLIPPGVSIDHPREIHVFDDPNIRYRIDQSGEVKKTIDPRSLENVFGNGALSGRKEIKQPIDHDRELLFN